MDEEGLNIRRHDVIAIPTVEFQRVDVGGGFLEPMLDPGSFFDKALDAFCPMKQPHQRL